MNQFVVETSITLIISLATFSYGVWLVSKTKKLKPFHVCLFWLAFCFGCAAGGLLEISMGGGDDSVENIRGICELASIIILFIYAIWATALKVITDEKSLRIFIRDSKLVWKIWIVPFALQIILGLI